MVKRISRWVIIFVGLILVTGFIGFSYIKAQFAPVDPASTEEITISIPKGSSSVNIANILKEEELIKNELVFQYFAKYIGSDMDLKAGDFALAKRMDIREIIQELVNGDTKIETVWFTIPEGYNVKQIADRLSEQGLIQKDKFLQLAKVGNFDYDFVRQIPSDENIEFRLEGYLFPETYQIRKGATEEEIIEKMLSQFEKEWKSEWSIVMEERELTLHQMVTLASIVEREAVVDKERPIIAGVFYNRLEDSWLLQSCATVQYALGKQRDIITYADLEITHPYNTYINLGLPPGSIGNPGRKSIEAVINPTSHQYYFFVTKKDLSGEHFFSKTLNEHLNNNAKSKGSW